MRTISGVGRKKGRTQRHGFRNRGHYKGMKPSSVQAYSATRSFKARLRASAAFSACAVFVSVACTAELNSPLDDHSVTSGGNSASGTGGEAIGGKASGGAGNGVGGQSVTGGVGSVNPSGGSGASGGSGGVPLDGRGLPCDVQDILVNHCESCHYSTNPSRLITRDDLLAVSGSDPQLSVGEVAVERLKMTTKGMMPPADEARPTADQIAIFEAYINTGVPLDTCATDVPPPPEDPFDVPETCTSNSNWTGGNRESPNMNPGEACIQCHTREDEGPDLTIAGTLYATAHEPDDCNGQKGSSAVYIEIVDAADRVFKLTPNSAGNFMLEDPDQFSFPYTARVVSGDEERIMKEAQDNGDCNACHTQDGNDGAPGRIILP
jgi:hypothetical protein